MVYTVLVNVDCTNNDVTDDDDNNDYGNDYVTIDSVALFLCVFSILQLSYYVLRIYGNHDMCGALVVKKVQGT